MSFSLFCLLALATPPGAPPPAVTALTHELHSPNTITRSRAARELGALKEEAGAAVPDLARALADVDQFVAREAAEALGKIGAAAVPALRKALWSDDARVRLRALMALSRCCPQDPPTIALLARTLKEDPDANVRRWAALTLDRIGLTKQGLIANLTAALADEDLTVRYSAAIALTRYGVEAKETTARLALLVTPEVASLKGAATDMLRTITATFGKPRANSHE